MKTFSLRVFLILSTLSILAGLQSCDLFTHKRKIGISYTLKQETRYVPSYQVALWLEKPDGQFVKTLFVSNYLAFGGFLVPDVCGTWSEKANWQNVSKEEFDAVSGETPRPGKVKLTLENSKNRIPDGEYRIFMQIHLKEDKNELYVGEIKCTGKKFQTVLKPVNKGNGDEHQEYLATDIHITCK